MGASQLRTGQGPRLIQVIVLIVVGVILAVVGCTTTTNTPTTAPAPPATATKPAATTPVAAPTATAAPTIRRGGTMKVAQRLKPSPLDPLLQHDGNAEIMGLIYDYLVDVDENGKLVPMLAESWQASPDGKTITFKLRKGVKFHDGTAFNAAAVKYHFDRLTNAKEKGSRAAILSSKIASVEVVDDATVKTNLGEPSATVFLFALNLHGGSLVSPAAVEKWGKDYGMHPVSTGPFKLVDFKPDLSITLEANKDYWRTGKDGKSLPYVDGAVIQLIPDDTVRLTNLRTGTVDAIEAVAPKDVPLVKESKDLQLAEMAGGAVSMMYFNAAKPPFENVALRQAVAYATDKDAILKAVDRGFGVVTETVVSAGYGDIHDPSVKSFPYDLAKAKEKLKEGGKPDGFNFRLNVLQLPTEVQRAEALQAQMAKIGVKVDIKQLPATEFIGALYSGDYDTVTNVPFLVVEPFFMMGSTLLPPRYKAGVSIGWDNAKYTGLFDKLEQSYDAAARKTVYSEMQKILAAEVPIMAMTTIPKNYAMGKYVRDFYPGLQRTIRIDRAWMDK